MLVTVDGTGLAYHIEKYDCSTTAGAPEKCSVNFS